MGEQLELGVPTLFWAGETGELQPLKVSDANFDIEPPSNWVQEDKGGFSETFEMTIDEKQTKNLRKLFKRRLPRKVKKMYKKFYAKYFGVKPSKVRLTTN